MLIRMLAIAASPEMVLESGKVYNVPKKLADQLLTPHPILKIASAELVPPGFKGAVTKIPATPDPDDKPELMADNFDELQVDDA